MADAADPKQADIKEQMHAELIKKAQVEEVKREADNEKYTRAMRQIMFDVADDLRRTVAKSEALKAMDQEQAARAHAMYFKTYIAESIGANAGGDGKDDTMTAVREELLRELSKKEAEVAAKDEQYRRVMEAFKDEICHDIRRAVAQQKAKLDMETEKAQRVQMDHMAEVGEELRRAVAAKEADAAVKVEQSQRIQADYFKRMIAGQIAKNEELSSSPSMRSVQKSLLEEIAARAKE